MYHTCINQHEYKDIRIEVTEKVRYEMLTFLMVSTIATYIVTKSG